MPTHQTSQQDPASQQEAVPQDPQAASRSSQKDSSQKNKHSESQASSADAEVQSTAATEAEAEEAEIVAQDQQPDPAKQAEQIAQLQTQLHTLQTSIGVHIQNETRLNQELVEQKAKLSATLDQYREAKAEFGRVQERMERATKSELANHKKAFIRSLLDLADNLDRAGGPDAPAGQDLESVQKGVAMMREQFLEILAQHKVRRLQSQGKPFDPHHHEAVATVPVPTAAQHDTVVGVIKECFVFEDEVLRPGLVAVGKASQ